MVLASRADTSTNGSEEQKGNNRIIMLVRRAWSGTGSRKVFRLEEPPATHGGLNPQGGSRAAVDPLASRDGT